MLESYCAFFDFPQWWLLLVKKRACVIGGSPFLFLLSLPRVLSSLEVIPLPPNCSPHRCDMQSPTCRLLTFLSCSSIVVREPTGMMATTPFLLSTPPSNSMSYVQKNVWPGTGLALLFLFFFPPLPFWHFSSVHKLPTWIVKTRPFKISLACYRCFNDKQKYSS